MRSTGAAVRDRGGGADGFSPGCSPERSGGTARCGIAADLPQDSSTGCNDQTAGNGAGSVNICTDRERHLPLSTEVQQNIHTATDTGSGVGECAGVCEIPNAETDPGIWALRNGNFNPRSFNRHLIDVTGCNTLKRDVRRGSALQEPLSGILDHREFLRVKVEPGRCDICNTAKAVCRSREAQTTICEGHYARLVREGNGREGVR